MRMLQGLRQIGSSGLLFLMAGLASACGTARPIEPKPPSIPADRGARCQVRHSQNRPLIVEWPSTDRAHLEALVRRGLVAVRYSGCEIEVLSQCKLEGTYAYTPVTVQSDRVTIRDEDELYANVPVGAAKLEGKLGQRGELNVDTTIVGTFSASVPALGPEARQGACSRATHVIAGLSVGAFEFYAGAAGTVGGGASIAGLGGGATKSAQRETLSRSGNGEACVRSTTRDTEPPDGCGALIRIEVVPIQVAGGIVATPKAVLPPGPGPGLNPSPATATATATATAGGAPAGSGDESSPNTSPETSGPSPGGPPRALKPMPGLGVRGGMAFAAGGLDKEIRAEEMGYVGWLFGLEGGYRFTRVFAAGLFGEVYGFEPGKGFCSAKLSCSLGVATGGLELITSFEKGKGTVWWLGAQGGYRYFVLKREGQDETLGDLKTRLSYHALFGGLLAGVEFQDAYVRDIRYGPMISYSMGKALSSSGTGLDDAMELAASQLEGGYLHTITLGARLVYGL